MNASPSAVWEVVSDVTRVGEFSPETFGAEWLDGATGPAVGATFRGHVKRNEVGPVYWTTCRVTRCEPEADFAFEVFVGKTPVNTWRYQLTPSGDGTDVTESFALRPGVGSKIFWAVAGRWRGRRNERGMQQTLDRIKAVVEGT